MGENVGLIADLVIQLGYATSLVVVQVGKKTGSIAVLVIQLGWAASLVVVLVVGLAMIIPKNSLYLHSSPEVTF